MKAKIIFFVAIVLMIYDLWDVAYVSADEKQKIGTGERPKRKQPDCVPALSKPENLKSTINSTIEILNKLNVTINKKKFLQKN